MKVKARQRDVYYFIKHFIAAYKAAPTYKEICNGCRIKSKSHSFDLVKHLIAEGYLEKNKNVNTNRQLKLTKKRYRIIM
jgi:SOS-response transcriptional repressor LexA